MQNAIATPVSPLARRPFSPQMLPSGSVLSVPVGFITHYGIACWDAARARLTVVSNSLRAGGVVEQSLHEFADGERVQLHGFPSSRPAWQVVGWAKSQIGRPYHMVRANCEHFWREAHGLERRSPQLVQATVLGLAGAVLIYAGRQD